MGQREEIISRENMLKKIRHSFLVPKENPFEDNDFSIDVFKQFDDIPEMVFAKQLLDNGGDFIYCEDIADFHFQFKKLEEINNWIRYRVGSQKLIDFLKINENSIVKPDFCLGEEVSVTQCEYLVARTGSIVMSSTICPDRLAWSFCDVHVVVASIKQLVSTLTDAYLGIKENYNNDNYPSLISVISGPSRTADIEKQIVMGAHGPSKVYVFLIDKT